MKNLLSGRRYHLPPWNFLDASHLPLDKRKEPRRQTTEYSRKAFVIQLRNKDHFTASNTWNTPKIAAEERRIGGKTQHIGRKTKPENFKMTNDKSSHHPHNARRYHKSSQTIIREDDRSTSTTTITGPMPSVMKSPHTRKSWRGVCSPTSRVNATESHSWSTHQPTQRATDATRSSLYFYKMHDCKQKNDVVFDKVRLPLGYVYPLCLCSLVPSPFSRNLFISAFYLPSFSPSILLPFIFISARSKRSNLLDRILNLEAVTSR